MSALARSQESEMSNSHTLPRMSRPLLNNNDGRRPIVKIAEHPQRSRPASLYDNLRTGNSAGGSFLSGGAALGTVSTGNLSCVSSVPRTRPMDRSPSQTQCLSTTVPQNIAALDLGGRHAPTRSSLRHSRMIVQTRTGKVARKYQPHVMKNHRLATSLVALQVLMGLAVTTLAVWLLLWAPHLRVRDIPYWSGIPLLLCGIFGLTLLCCCRKEYPGMPHGMIIFSIKQALSVFLSVVAGCACFCACVFSLLHLVFLSQMNCEPPHALNSTCVCRSGDINDPNQRTYHYSDLNCAEIGILSVLLIGSCAGNGIGGILSTWYVFLHWNSRYSYLYSEVKTNNKRPIVISNKLGKKSQRK